MQSGTLRSPAFRNAVGFSASLALALCCPWTAAAQTPETLQPHLPSVRLSDQQSVTIRGFLSPVEYSGDDFHLNWDSLKNFRIAEGTRTVAATTFQPLLPSADASVGEIWSVEPTFVKRLLSQFHPHPSTEMHINAGDSQGAFACLRALNDRFAEIVFRIHAEFVLEDGWFTPSQFAGHLLVDRQRSDVVSFRVFVPEGTINFDVNRRLAPNRVITSAGFLPRMELVVGVARESLDPIQWSAELSQAESQNRLDRKFYRHRRIAWVDVEEAWRLAKERNRPLHVVSIDGPLDDEAC